MDYEAAVISKVVIGQDMNEVLDLRVQPELFVQYPKEWTFVLDFYRRHGSPPPLGAFEKSWPDFELGSRDAPFSFLVEELRKRRTHNLITEALKTSAEHLKAKDPMEALESFRLAVAKAEVETRPARDINVAEDPLSRVKRYEELVEQGGITGLPTPWPVLDEVTLGLQPEELWMIVARGGVGKTWAEVIMAVFHWSAGLTPLLFTREMSVDQIVRRIDANFARLHYHRFRGGQLTTEEFERWQTALQSMKGSLPFWVSGDDDGASGVSGIEAKVDRYKPDVVYIDGMYLIQDDQKGDSGWQRIANVAWDLKQMARRKRIPVIVSHQFNKEAKGDTGTADNLAYSDIQKWFDVILGMYQTDDLRMNNEMLFRLLKQREGERIEYVSTWDLQNMEFDTKKMGADDAGEFSDTPTPPVEDDDLVRF